MPENVEPFRFSILPRMLPSEHDKLRAYLRTGPAAAQKVAATIGAFLQSYTHTNTAEEGLVFCLAVRLDMCDLWEYITPQDLLSGLDPQPLPGIRDAFLGTGAWAKGRPSNVCA